jgi:uroporphyrinogen decarboxylase
MNSKFSPRERFDRIMHHQEADRVPLDLAGTSLTGIAQSVINELLNILEIDGEPSSDYQPIDERILQAFDIDFRRIGRLIASGDHPVPGRSDQQVDMWGVVRAWTGQYWDIIVNPLKGASVEDLDRYPWPEPGKWIEDAELIQLREQAKCLYEKTDYVIVAEHPVYGVFELACWMCGFDDFLWRLAGDRLFVNRLFSILLSLQKEFIRPYYQAIGNYIHLTTSGDDFGTQIAPFLSPRAFRELVKPYFSERITYTREFTPSYFWHHSCGSIFDLLPDLIEAGVDILNPIQPGAAKMEPEHLKLHYGNQLVFHGGFDTQNFLPFGTESEIESEVQRVMRELKPEGGFIFSAAHNIQEDVPAINVVRMYQAAKKYGVYE